MLPTAVPFSGVAQVPLVTDVAAPHEIGAVANRTSYFAGWPVPSSAWVKERVAEVLSVAATARSVTVAGLVTTDDEVVTVSGALPALPSLLAVI